MEEPKTRKRKLLKYKQATNLDFRESTYTQISSLRLRATSSAGLPLLLQSFSTTDTLSSMCHWLPHILTFSPLSLSLSLSHPLSQFSAEFVYWIFLFSFSWAWSALSQNWVSLRLSTNSWERRWKKVLLQKLSHSLFFAFSYERWQTITWLISTNTETALGVLLQAGCAP